ncbi:MAG: hypothetical protein GY757_21095, partial [bacterium]|nr:hypothetical protein [bacterium]
MRIQKLVITILLIGFLKSLCFPVDPSIYWGTWSSNGKPVDIEIKIGDQLTGDNIRVKINKNVLTNVTFDFVYGKTAPIPFLYISSSENELKTHFIYLVIGARGKFEGSDNYD